jgi:hypothetical protein
VKKVMFWAQLFLILFVGLVQGPGAYAQEVSNSQAGNKPSGALVGSIEYADVKESESNPQLQSLEDLRRWVASVDKIAVDGGKGVPEELTPADLSYLSVAYLYCVAQRGTCPFVLDTILDSDLETSLSNGVAGCSTMKRFWKEWLRSALDERAKFLLSVSNGLKLAAFNSQERPRYVQCSNTVAELMAQHNNLGSRFGGGGTSRSSLSSIKQFLEELHTSKVDIYQEIGVSHGQGN